MDNSRSSNQNGVPRDLPQEIWLRIFQLIAPEETRTVELSTLTYGQVAMRRQGAIPTALHVNHDARAAALNHYQMAFVAIYGRGVFFDFERDNLDMQNVQEFWHDMYAAVHPELALVRYATAGSLPMFAPGIQRTSHAFDFSSLYPFTGLRVLRLPRDNDRLRVFPGIARYDAEAVLQFHHWWTNNMPQTSPVPFVIFFNVPERGESFLRESYPANQGEDQESMRRNMRWNQIGGRYGGLGGTSGL